VAESEAATTAVSLHLRSLGFARGCHPLRTSDFCRICNSSKLSFTPGYPEGATSVAAVGFGGLGHH